MKKPIDVVCPKCFAAITAKCTEVLRGIGGRIFVDNFCSERIKAAEKIDSLQGKR